MLILKVILMIKLQYGIEKRPTHYEGKKEEKEIKDHYLKYEGHKETGTLYQQASYEGYTGHDDQI